MEVCPIKGQHIVRVVLMTAMIWWLCGYEVLGLCGVVAVVLVMDVMRVIAFVERDVFRGVGVDPSEQGDSGGPDGG